METDAAMRAALRHSRFAPVLVLRLFGELEQALHGVQILANLPVQRIGLLERLDRIVQEFVDDSPGQLLELRSLLFADLAELIDGAQDFFLRDLVIALVKLIDQWAKLAGAMPGDEILELLLDDFSRGLNGAGPL